METLRKVTMMLPSDLVERALKASGQGLTETVRQGLNAVAAADVYDELLTLKGKVPFPENFLEDLRRD
jgi:hypothetical protein